MKNTVPGMIGVQENARQRDLGIQRAASTCSKQTLEQGLEVAEKLANIIGAFTVDDVRQAMAAKGFEDLGLSATAVFRRNGGKFVMVGTTTMRRFKSHARTTVWRLKADPEWRTKFDEHCRKTGMVVVFIDDRK